MLVLINNSDMNNMTLVLQYKAPLCSCSNPFGILFSLCRTVDDLTP